MLNIYYDNRQPASVWLPVNLMNLRDCFGSSLAL